MRVLVVGSGAREHALVMALDADAAVTAIAAAPGNPGMAGRAELLAVDPLDGPAVAELAAAWGADLVVIGPEAPLVAGVADDVRARGITCFGPSREAAALEGSKAFAKTVMAEAGVPTARARLCCTDSEVGAALAEFGTPHVVKDDGLAAGKGVVVCDDDPTALAHAHACLDKPDGRVVVEEFLDGPEVSLFCITDGTTVVPLQPAQDFKRLADGDEGPNTGGMGAYSPLPWAPSDLTDQVVEQVAQPTVDAMRRRGTPFAGVLYVGLALTSRGPRVVEFNARFGDPETQVVLARLRTPLSGVLHAAATGTLASLPPLVWSDDAAVTVVLASPGYPASPVTGGVIAGLDDERGALVLHAGTAVDADGHVVSAGGRVLSVVGTGRDLAAARDAAYRRLRTIELDGGQYRTDIARLAAEQQAGRTAAPA
ncbi:MAG TPA: phosphoribosylamine--glycine ligase [Actinomycetales bacterium]|nr:phosphoribosylamine--glycine ligase [Actinomycetales bacterium]